MTPDGYTSYAQLAVPVFHSTRCEDWTASKDSSEWGIKVYLPTPQLDVKRSIWRGLKVWKQKNKLQGEKKKIQQKKLEGKSLDIRDRGLENIPPPPPGRGEGDETIALPPPIPSPMKFSGIGALLSQMQLMSKQINIEFRKKESKILN